MAMGFPTSEKRIPKNSPPSSTPRRCQRQYSSPISRLSMASLTLYSIVCALSCSFVSASEETDDVDHGNNTSPYLGGENHEIEPAHAVIFPVFTLIIGVIVFYLLTRYARALPYTAVMVLIGTLMGIGAELLDRTDHISESILMWLPIDSEVLLLVFLPGLIFKDSLGQNVHLFRLSMRQLFLFAFPMVLAGTCLTALVAFHVLPYGFSPNLCLTFGSILSATDPVAVAALLEAVGAPPRLKVHIAGESLLNDGAAIVFFSIFSARYSAELGIDGIGEEIGWGRGIELFFHKSLGGVAIGIFFGLGLLSLLFMLDRRFNREENVVQVTATLGVAYLGYYVAEPVWEASGVISTVVTALIVKFFGRGMINDIVLLEDFWTLVEHILNTVLFTLGGAVWGGTITRGEEDGIWTGKDWGYLVALYLFLALIRAALFGIAYPVTQRIGLGTSWQETLFQIYGGLRGAVGIALALSMDNDAREIYEEYPNHDGIDDALVETSRVFAMVGGIAFFTLVINGITAGPLLIKLGLADESETRRKIIDAHKIRFRASVIDEMVRLLSQPRFRYVNFALVKHHVPILADLNKQQLLEAVERIRDSTPAEDYISPALENILPYLPEGDEMPYKRNGDDDIDAVKKEHGTVAEGTIDHERKGMRNTQRTHRRRRRHSSNLHFMLEQKEPLSSKEVRLLFVSILRAAYEKQIRDGELEDNHYLTIILQQSLEFTEDAVTRGEPLNDWKYVEMFEKPFARTLKHLKENQCIQAMLEKGWAKGARHGLKHTAKQIRIERSLSFMAAHRFAQKFIAKEFNTAASEISEAVKFVLQESEEQFKTAEQVLTTYYYKIVEVAVSHKFCMILLNQGVKQVEGLVKIGLLKESEAEHMVEQIEHDLEGVLSCDMKDHPGELSKLETGQTAPAYFQWDNDPRRRSRDM